MSFDQENANAREESRARDSLKLMPLLRFGWLKDENLLRGEGLYFGLEKPIELYAIFLSNKFNHTFDCGLVDSPSHLLVSTELKYSQDLLLQNLSTCFLSDFLSGSYE
jgi:hypothetical protein